MDLMAVHDIKYQMNQSFLYLLINYNILYI